jgi:hypothetical protein
MNPVAQREALVPVLYPVVARGGGHVRSQVQKRSKRPSSGPDSRTTDERRSSARYSRVHKRRSGSKKKYAES